MIQNLIVSEHLHQILENVPQDEHDTLWQMILMAQADYERFIKVVPSLLQEIF
jgi:hypothetical protein